MNAARNIELKARLPDLAAARGIAQRIATSYFGVEEQTDTYFHCAQGRLKLREIRSADGACKAQLIPYARSNQPDAKRSDYQLLEVSDHAGLKQALSTALGVSVVVVKLREIFLYGNVRIHLDQVTGLGTFIELEAVLGPDVDAATGHAQVANLRHQFGILPADQLSGSYADLVLAAQ
jgi:predicted adenylyl cyclase CyaB